MSAAEDHTSPLTQSGSPELDASGRELLPGMRVGPYRLSRILGQGGMGQVWLAEQQEPLRRLVALKLQRHRWSGSLAEALFEIERQALAQLLHPYVAQIYDAGQLPDGSLYFAMEYVDGLTLDQYIAQGKLSVRGVVELIIRVAQGVQHAHQRGLIHRDLKPGNVLVLDAGNQAIPKIIDFGVAVGMDPRSGAALGSSVVGTRAYMAPEQQHPTAEGIDVRVDVYALGAVLAECLALVNNVRLDLNDRSVWVSILGQTRSDSSRTTASQLTPNLRLLAKALPRELRAIARKASHENRTQRYDSVADFADDLQRWRDSRPVQAMGRGRGYAVRCFVNRHRLWTGAGVVVLLALVTGLSLAWYGLAQAQAARALAEARGDRAEQLIGYMLGDFSDKLRALGKLELLDGVSAEAMNYLGSDVDKRSDVGARGAFFRARALRTLGEVRNARGDQTEAGKIFANADAMLQLAPAGSVPKTELLLEQGNIAYWRGFVAYSAGDLEQAEQHWLNYQKFAQELVPLTPDTGKGLSELGSTYNNLGALAFERKDWEKSKDYFRRAIQNKQLYLTKKPEDPSTITDISNTYSWIGRVLENQADLNGAAQLYRQQADLASNTFDSNPDDVAIRYRFTLAHYWISLNAADRGETGLALKHLQIAIDNVQKLVALDATNSEWQVTLSSASLDQIWLGFLVGRQPDLETIRELKAEIAARLDGNDPRARRTWLRLHLRLALMRGDHSEFDWRQLKDLHSNFVTTDNDDERRLAWTVAIEIARRDGTKISVPELDLMDGKDFQEMHFRTAEVFARYALVNNMPNAFERMRDRLNNIGYRHPDYLRFISLFKPQPLRDS